jgi:hypothetical protein
LRDFSLQRVGDGSPDRLSGHLSPNLHVCWAGNRAICCLVV